MKRSSFKKRWSVRVLFLTFLLLISPLTYALSDKEKEALSGAVVSVEVYNGGSIGTGFLISSTEVVTNYHVVNFLEIPNFFNLPNIPDDFEITIAHKKGLKIKAEVKKANESSDLAILELETPIKPPYLELGSLDEIKKNQSVFVLGKGDEFQPLYGEVFDIYKQDLGSYRNHYNINSTLPITQGFSGSPLLSLDTGRVIGVVNQSGFDKKTSNAILVDHVKKLRETGNDANIDEELIEKEIPFALTAKGVEYYNNEEYNKALPFFNQASFSDHRAKAYLMLMYQEGLGVKKNLDKFEELKNEVLEKASQDTLREIGTYFFCWKI